MIGRLTMASYYWCQVLFDLKEFVLLTLLPHILEGRLLHRVEEEFEVFTLKKMLR